MHLVALRRRYRPLSKASSPSASPRLPATTPPTPSLGNKLQVLAGQSPGHLAIVEGLVDLMLGRLAEQPGQLIVPVLLWWC